MSYSTQAVLADDGFLRRRIIACAAGEHITSPAAWVTERMWQFSASPGWDAAYASAVAAGIGQPGNADAVITDGMILASVQALAGE